MKPWGHHAARSTHMGVERNTPVGSLDRWCKPAQRALCKLKISPGPIRLVVIGIAVLAACSFVNLVYQLLHKPTEVFAPISGEFNKAPVETWLLLPILTMTHNHEPIKGSEKDEHHETSPNLSSTARGGLAVRR